MNKKELITTIATKYDNFSKNEVEDMMNAIFDTIKGEMCKQQTVAITGFGHFGAKVRAARKGRNPSTGEELKLPEAVVPSFKAAAALKAAVNNAS